MKHHKIPLLLLALLWLVSGGSRLRAQDREPRDFELQPKSEMFGKLIAADAKLEKIAGGLGFTEGPVWDPKGFVYVSDEIQNAIYRVYPDGHKETEIEMVNPDGSTFDRQGHLITTASDLRAVVRVEPGGKYTMLADKYEGKKFNSPNDIVVGPDGALYFTDPTYDLPKDQQQELSFQGVFRLGSDGSLTLLNSELPGPNGLAFSPDGRKLYVDDSKLKEIHVWDFGPGAKLSNGRLFGKQEGRGAADGMKVDTQGNLWVTGPLGIWVWSPEGEHLGTIQLPENAANLAWGESDYQTLYFTATTSIYRLKTKVKGFVPYLRQ